MNPWRKSDVMLISDSRWMSHDLWDCSGFWLADSLSLSNSRMVRTKKTPRMGEGKWALQICMRVEVHMEVQEPQHWWTPQCQKLRRPPLRVNWRGGWQRQKDMERWGGAGVIAKLTVGPDGCGDQAIYIGWGGASQEEVPTYCGRQDPQKEFLRAGKVKKPQKYWLGMVAVHDICHFQKSMDLQIWKLPFSYLVHEIALEVERYDMHFQACAILTAGSCEGICCWASGRCQPLHNPHEMHNHHAQRHTISMMYPWRASALLKTFSPKSVSVFLLVVGCVGWEFSVGFALYMMMGIMGFVVVNNL